MEDVKGPFDYPRIKELVFPTEGLQSLKELDPPLGMKVFSPKVAGLQLAIVPKEGNDTFTVVKHFHISSKVDMRQMERIARGAIKVLNWSGSTGEARKAFQLEFERLGGCQYRLHALTNPRQGNGSSGDHADVLSPEQIDLGYDFIRDNVPHDPDDNSIPRWIKKCKSSPECPIFKFSKYEVYEAVKNLRGAGDFASTQTMFPLTLADVSAWFRPLLEKILPKLLNLSLVLLGEKKKGKTTLAEIIAMAWSRMRQAETGKDIKPGFRVTQDLDFLKDREGEVEIPVIFNDGDTWDLCPKSVLALLDMKAKESKTRERYTST